MVDKIKILIMCDDYNNHERTGQRICTRLIEETKKDILLDLVEEFPNSTNLCYYDIVLLDFGMLGNFTLDDMKRIEKIEDLTLLSALSPYHIYEDDYYKKFFAGMKSISFEPDKITTFLIEKIKGE